MNKKIYKKKDICDKGLEQSKAKHVPSTHLPCDIVHVEANGHPLQTDVLLGVAIGLEVGLIQQPHLVGLSWGGRLQRVYLYHRPTIELVHITLFIIVPEVEDGHYTGVPELFRLYDCYTCWATTHTC